MCEEQTEGGGEEVVVVLMVGRRVVGRWGVGVPPYRDITETVIAGAACVLEDIAVSLVNQGIIMEALVLGHTAFLNTNSSQAELRAATSLNGFSGAVSVKEQSVTLPFL